MYEHQSPATSTMASIWVVLPVSNLHIASICTTEFDTFYDVLSGGNMEILPRHANAGYAVDNETQCVMDSVSTGHGLRG